MKKLELNVKSFDELTVNELYELLRLRCEVFVAEQKCAYADIDGLDKNAYHVFLSDGDSIEAYLRVLPRGAVFAEVSLGRVVVRQRRQGLGTRIVEAGIETARRRFGADAIRIEAQTYARSLYEKLGFRQASEEFLEDGIPHIVMLKEPE